MPAEMSAGEGGAFPVQIGDVPNANTRIISRASYGHLGERLAVGKFANSLDSSISLDLVVGRAAVWCLVAVLPFIRAHPWAVARLR